MREDSLSITAPIFNIQSYSIHDGPGIRVTVFVKGCPLRCLWCANPESGLSAPQLMTYDNMCTVCGRCIEECPVKAIAVSRAGDALTAVTDRKLCLNCGKCVAVCPSNAREIVGKSMSVQEVLKKVLRDKMFIDASGGGMTISGGECLLYPDFSESLLYNAKREGLHTAVETCCFAVRDTVDRVFKYVDLGLLDIKHMNPDEHEKLTGVRNESILDNIRHIYHDLKIRTVIRVPVIPGYNDSDENVAAVSRFVADDLGKDVAVHLLPYHRMGESKNRSLGRTPLDTIEIPSDEHMQHLQEITGSFGLQSQIGG